MILWLFLLACTHAPLNLADAHAHIKSNAYVYAQTCAKTYREFDQWCININRKLIDMVSFILKDIYHRKISIYAVEVV